ncbi:hypothetical protein DH2020_047817 [Rehmannia glutinosa]|uniref:Uncharacterized protein n=1 Tax=Rehmannia glutinosa TaxID=99300 RepID=A0ABR0U7B1_REHGL
MAISFLFCLTLISILTSSLLFHKFITSKNKKNKNKKLPPGPKGVPILGHLHMLGKNPHQDLHKLAKQHGPIMYMQFGFVPNIIVSSPKSAELFLKTHDLVFASRPPHQAAKYISWDQRNLSFGPYGPYWRNMRKLCTLELLSNLKINSFQPMRKEELGMFIESLKECRGVVDISAKISALTAEMSCRMVFGKKYEDKDIDERGFKSVIQEGMRLAAVPNLGDYFPFLGVLDLQGLTRKMKALAKVFDDFFEKVIDEHVRDGRSHGKVKDFVDTMMSIMQSGQFEFQFDRRHVKAVLLVITPKKPKSDEKVQKELENVVGLDRMVEESDLDQLQYLDMVVKETFRLHPAAPLLLPHYAMEDCTVDGYDIKKESRIIVNTYAIGRIQTRGPIQISFFPRGLSGVILMLGDRIFSSYRLARGGEVALGYNWG